MPSFAHSADGTVIAYDRCGHGDPLIVVAGLLCDRRRSADLAVALAAAFDVVNFDRRGRGDSTNTLPYAVEREIEDLAALIDVVGGHADVYGHSSGAALALRAAAAGLPIGRLVLHEPPYGPDDSRLAARRLAETVSTAVNEHRPHDAITAFFGDSGLPPDIVESISTDPATAAMAPTMVHDHLIMGDFDQGGTIPVDLARSISPPTLVLAGSDSPDFFRTTAERLTAVLPNGQLLVLDGAAHDAAAAVVAPAVIWFLSTRHPQP